AIATNVTKSGQRVFKMRLLRMSVRVWKPISGSKSPKASRAVTPASRRACEIATRPSCAPSAMSNLFDIRPAEQALRQEDQRDRQNRKRSDILVVDRKIGRP